MNRPTRKICLKIGSRLQIITAPPRTIEIGGVRAHISRAVPRAAMKNITITVNDDLYRHARIYAAQRDTTVTELIRDFLLNLKTGPENATECRAQTIRDRLTADKNAINDAQTSRVSWRR
jgi:hypothetical protein